MSSHRGGGGEEGKGGEGEGEERREQREGRGGGRGGGEGEERGRGGERGASDLWVNMGVCSVPRSSQQQLQEGPERVVPAGRHRGIQKIRGALHTQRPQVHHHSEEETVLKRVAREEEGCRGGSCHESNSMATTTATCLHGTD